MLPFKQIVMTAWMALLLGACTSAPQNEDADLSQQIGSHNPQAAAYNAELGIGYLREGDVPRAKAKLLLAQKQDPDSPDVWDSLAFFYETTGDTKEAERLYLKAIHLDPKKGGALNDYGVFLCKVGRYSESLSYFLKANADPDYLNVAATYENAGLCAEEIPDPKSAQQFFILALKNNPDLPVSSLELAEIYFNQGTYEVANRYLQRYNAIAKPTAESIWLDAKLARQANQNDRMIADIQLLKQNFPQSDAYKQAVLSQWGKE